MTIHIKNLKVRQRKGASPYSYHYQDESLIIFIYIVRENCINWSHLCIFIPLCRKSLNCSCPPDRNPINSYPFPVVLKLRTTHQHLLLWCVHHNSQVCLPVGQPRGTFSLSDSVKRQQRHCFIAWELRCVELYLYSHSTSAWSPLFFVCYSRSRREVIDQQ